MIEIIKPSRRGLLAGFATLFAAPAIIKIAKLMPISVPEEEILILPKCNGLLTINMITRESIRLWKNSNAFLQNIDKQYDNSFAVSGARIDQRLRIRLPNATV